MNGKSESIATFSNVSKTFGNTAALQDLEFTIKKGVNGLIGPNGAGKTTMIKLLLGLLTPTQGTVKVFQKSPQKSSDIFEYIGWCSEGGYPVPWLTPREYLSKILHFYDWEGEIHSRVKEIADTFDITSYIDTKHQHLSLGMTQRVKVARAFIHQPCFVILDEPLQGLDISHKHMVQNFMKTYGKHGNTILYASHLLSEVEKISDYIIFLYDGHFIAQGRISQLRKQLFQFPLRIKIKIRNHVNAFLQEIITHSSIDKVSILQRDKQSVLIEVHSSDPDQFLSQIASIVLTVNSELIYLKILDIDLLSLFKYLKKAAIGL